MLASMTGTTEITGWLQKPATKSGRKGFVGHTDGTPQEGFSYPVAAFYQPFSQL